MLPSGRPSGILLPLFSLRSRSDFGIGDFGAVEGLFDWMGAARQKFWMLLPLLPTAPSDPSPYGTRSAFGLNPLFIDLAAVPEFQEAGGFSRLTDDERRKLDEARSSATIRYDLVFGLKKAALRRAFDHFEATHWRDGDARAEAVRQYAREQADWLDTFALYTAISLDRHLAPWWEWPQPLRDRQPEALAAERDRLQREVLFHTWAQYVTEGQWSQVRKAAARRGLLVCGDEPFIIGNDSSDAWANPQLLRRDARLGVPPDDFSADGQDWGLPYFDFDAMAKDGYRWLRFRARKAAAYYDLRRVDHAIGYFRQWIRDEKTPRGRFVPDDEASQQRLGEHHFRMLSEGTGIVAEDLGVVPPFMRDTLTRLGLPGYKVMRWERHDGVYHDPRQFAPVSLATTGTHDTETLREWWEKCDSWEREAAGYAWPELQGLPLDGQFTPAVHEALVAGALNSASNLCCIPWQDVYGARERVNLPGSLNDGNWTYRIPQYSDELLTREETRNGAEWLARLTAAAGR